MKTTIIYYSPVFESIMLVQGESWFIEVMLSMQKLKHTEPAWTIIDTFEEEV